MSVIASNTVEDDEDLRLDKAVWHKLHRKGFEGVDQETSSESELEDLEESKEHDADSDVEVSDDEDDEMIEDEEGEQESNEDESDVERQRTNEMAEQFEDNYNKEREYMQIVDRKAAKKEIKKKQLIEQQRLRQEDQEEDELLRNDDLMDEGKDSNKAAEESENDDDLLDHYGDESGEGDEDAEDKDEDDKPKKQQSLFVNPLVKKTKRDDSDVSEGEWSDEDSDSGDDKKGGKGGNKSLLTKRRRKDLEDADAAKQFFKDEGFEEVPMDTPKGADEDDMVSVNSDEIAETRVLARMMLRKKARQEMIDGSYNRFAFHEDEHTLPSWFVEDEARHSRPNINISKEEVAYEKQLIKDYNSRPSKKVSEAKARKKKRLAKAMTKVQNKAKVIADGDLNEASKMRQIQKLYKKESKKNVEEKKYVVNRSFNSI